MSKKELPGGPRDSKLAYFTNSDPRNREKKTTKLFPDFMRRVKSKHTKKKAKK